MKQDQSLRQFLAISTLVLSLFIPSCCSPENPDPFEKLNRSLYKVDQTLDKYILNPVVQVYDKALPSFVHTGVDNFFSNTFEPARIANDLLQFDVADALNDFGRFFVNSTVGVLGIFDVAKHMGMVKHRNDFGITLAKWGIRNTPYLYLPCLGPMTVRDSLSIGVDYFLLNPISYIPSDKVRLSLIGLGKVHYRWKWLPAKKVIDESFDPYVFVRNAYLQKRQAMIDEVVNGHHAAEDTFVKGFEDEPVTITEEDHHEAKENKAQLENTPSDTTSDQEPSHESRPSDDSAQTTPKKATHSSLSSPQLPEWFHNLQPIDVS